MKKLESVFAGLLFATAVFVLSGQISRGDGQSAAPTQPASPEQVAAKAKARWTRALAAAQRDFVATNDRESAEFVGRMLASLEEPDGLSPVALTVNRERLQQFKCDLVRRGALESAASLDSTQIRVSNQAGPGMDGPARTEPRRGGAPGPGGLVLYLPFDEPDKEGVVRDVSGAGNDGRVIGATWVAEGRIGGAYRFKITNLEDRIVIPDSDSLNPEFLTVAAWIACADADGFWNRILDKDYRRSYALSLGGDFNGKGSRGRLIFEDHTMYSITDRVVGDGRWHHVAATFDGQVNRIYVDGLEQKQGKAVQPGPLPGGRWDLCIGNSVVDYGTGEINAFDGLIDEVRIFNRAFSAAEIMTLATAPQTGAKVAPAAVSSSAKPDTAEASEPKYGLYLHYGMDTFRNAREEGPLPVARFAPVRVDVAGWARAAKEAGMTFALLTAKHESGFCLWKSTDNNYDLAHSSFKGDVIADFIAACKAEGILPGVHYSIPDAHNEGVVRSEGVVPPPYFNVIRQHITELHTQYPGLRVLLIDGARRLSPEQFDELSRIAKRLAPQCEVWADGRGNEAATVNRRWMWSANDSLTPPQRLFAAYQRCQSAGKTFVLNVGPMPTGAIPDDQIAVLKKLKDLIANPPAAKPTSEVTSGKLPVAERLQQVKQLYDQGLIDKEAYDTKVKEITITEGARGK